MVRLLDPLSQTEEQARMLLRRHKVYGAQIVRRDSESILFLQEGEPFTAWVSEDFREILRMDRGFVAVY
jgi:hypothetical protein